MFATVVVLGVGDIYKAEDTAGLELHALVEFESEIVEIVVGIALEEDRVDTADNIVDFASVVAEKTGQMVERYVARY